MSTRKIRIGNQISLQWMIMQGESAYDLSAKTNKVYLVAPMARYEVKDFSLSGENHNIIGITWKGIDQRYCGEYHLMLVSCGTNGENMFTLDSQPAFILTPVTDHCAASTAVTIQLTDTIMMPSSGESLYEMMVRNGKFEGTEEEFLQQYLDALQACEEAAQDANAAAAEADTAAGEATAAAASANTAAGTANTAASNANAKAQQAATAASNANTKADAAHTAAIEAGTAAELAGTNAGLAATAAASANTAAGTANTAASNADAKAQQAATAASAAASAAQGATYAAASANTAAGTANTAASNADAKAQQAATAASAANTAAQGAGNVNVTIAETTLTVTDRDGHSTSVNTKGEKGDPGDVSQEEFTQLAQQVDDIPFAYMEGARVGTADNLTPDGTPLTKSIKSATLTGIQTGSALIKSVKGNTAVWNQLCNAETITTNTTHKYLKIVGGVASFVTGVASISGLTAGTDLVYDLTLMFTAGNEPTTVAEFEARCPQVADPYAYNAGEIVGMTASGLQVAKDGAVISERKWANILATYFGGVMHKVATVYDEFTSTKAIKRLGIVDLGSLSWRTWITADRQIFIGGYIEGNGTNINFCAIGYTPTTETFASMSNKTIRSTVSSIKEVYIRDDDYADEVAFKAAMQGVMLIYELATPEEHTYDELAMTYAVENGAEESMIAEGESMPIVADIVYPINAYNNIVTNKAHIGNLANLATTAKDDLVSAINEIYGLLTNAQAE